MLDTLLKQHNDSKDSDPAQAFPTHAGKAKALLVGGTATLLASAALVTVAAPPAQAATIARRWYGVDVLLSRNDTNNVILGTAGAAVGALGIPDPTISKVVAIAAGGSAVYATWAYNRGACLKFRIVPSPVPPFITASPNHYYGGYCR